MNPQYFFHQGAHIRNLFLHLVMKNMASEEGNQLLKWCDALIVVAKYNKFRSENTTVCFCGPYQAVYIVMLRSEKY